MNRLGDLNCIEIDGTYTHPALDVTERDLLEITGGTVFLTTINLDVSALLLNATFRIYYKIDGTNYRLRYGTGPAGGTIAWTTTDGDWVSFLVNGIWDHDIKITVQTSGVVGEALARDIPYSYNGAR